MVFTLVIYAILTGGIVQSQVLETYETLEACIVDRDITREEFEAPGLVILCINDHNEQMESDATTDGGGL